MTRRNLRLIVRVFGEQTAMSTAVVSQRELAGVGRGTPLAVRDQVAGRREKVAALPTRLLGRRQEATQAFGRVVTVAAKVLRFASSAFLDFGEDVVNRRLEA